MANKTEVGVRRGVANDECYNFAMYKNSHNHATCTPSLSPARRCEICDSRRMNRALGSRKNRAGLTVVAGPVRRLGGRFQHRSVRLLQHPKLQNYGEDAHARVCECMRTQPPEQYPMTCTGIRTLSCAKKISSTYSYTMYYGLWIIGGVVQPTGVNERR